MTKTQGTPLAHTTRKNLNGERLHTRAAETVTKVIPVFSEYSPEAKGRYGLFTYINKSIMLTIIIMSPLMLMVLNWGDHQNITSRSLKQLSNSIPRLVHPLSTHCYEEIFAKTYLPTVHNFFNLSQTLKPSLQNKTVLWKQRSNLCIFTFQHRPL